MRVRPSPSTSEEVDADEHTASPADRRLPSSKAVTPNPNPHPRSPPNPNSSRTPMRPAAGKATAAEGEEEGRALSRAEEAGTVPSPSTRSGGEGEATRACRARRRKKGRPMRCRTVSAEEPAGLRT